MTKTWAEFDEPIRRVVLASLDSVVADLLADVAYNSAHSAGSMSMMKLVVDSQLGQLREQAGEDTVRAAMQQFEPILAAFSTAASTADMVHDAIASAHEAANAILDGKSSAEWAALSVDQRDVLLTGLCANGHKYRQRRFKENIGSEVSKGAGAAGMAAVVNALGAGANATIGAAQGFQVGFDTSKVVDETISDAFIAAEELLMSVDEAKEEAA